MSSLESNSHFYLYNQSYQHITAYEVIILEPVYKPYDIPNNFINWRKIVDSISPWRVSSTLIDNLTKKKSLKYIFDGYGDTIRFIKKVTKEWPNLIYYIKPIQNSKK